MSNSTHYGYTLREVNYVDGTTTNTFTIDKIESDRLQIVQLTFNVDILSRLHGNHETIKVLEIRIPESNAMVQSRFCTGCSHQSTAPRFHLFIKIATVS